MEGRVGRDQFGEAAASSEEEEEEEEGVNMSCTLFKHGLKKKSHLRIFIGLYGVSWQQKRRRNIRNDCNEEQKDKNML